MKLFERTIFYSALKVIFFSLAAFIFLYILVDYSIHARAFHHGMERFPWQELMIYYFNEVTSRLDTLLPFAFLLGSLATLCRMNKNRELVALFAGGIAAKRIIRPLIVIGLLGVLLLYVVEENPLEQYNISKNTKPAKKAVHHLALKDETTLLFSEYDKDKQIFHDVWWIRSPQEFIHVDDLTLESPPVGKGIHYFIKNNGVITHARETHTEVFPKMRFNKKQIFDHFTDVRELSLSTLWKKSREQAPGERLAQIKTALAKKAILPWFCLLAIVLPLPYAVKFSRNNAFFSLTALSLFTLAALFLSLNAGAVLSERQVLPIWVAMGAIPAFGFVMGSVKYLRV